MILQHMLHHVDGTIVKFHLIKALVQDALPNALAQGRVRVGSLKTCGGLGRAADSLARVVPCSLRGGIGAMEKVAYILLKTVVHKSRALAAKASNGSRLGRVHVLVVEVLESAGSIANHIFEIIVASSQGGIQGETTKLRNRAGVRFG